MIREEILEFIQTLPHTGYDMPFKDDFFSTVLRRKDNNKWFGLIFKAPEKYLKSYGAPCGDGVILNLKCPPDLREFLREAYPRAVLPAYHMNKIKWISVVLSAEIPQEEVKKLITLSYELVKGNKK